MVQPVRRDDVIHIRASAETRAMLSRAAAVRGQKLSEFMLDSARRQAEEAMLDQRIFFLDDKAHKKLLVLLDAAMKPGRGLKALMARKPVWQRQAP